MAHSTVERENKQKIKWIQCQIGITTMSQAKGAWSASVCLCVCVQFKTQGCGMPHT